MKAIAGKTLSFIISLIVAVAALAILWAFFISIIPNIPQIIKALLSSFHKAICAVSGFLGFLLGC